MAQWLVKGDRTNDNNDWKTVIYFEKFLAKVRIYNYEDNMIYTFPYDYEIWTTSIIINYYYHHRKKTFNI